MTKKLIGLYNVRDMLKKNMTTGQIAQAIYDDVKAKLKEMEKEKETDKKGKE